MEAGSARQEWFSGPGMKHPLADPATVGALVAKHSSGESAAVLKRITEWVDELDQLPDVPLGDRYEVLDLLDRHAKNHQITLVPEYLESARLRKLSDGSLWTTSFEFWKTMGTAYLHCLDRYQTTTDAPPGFGELLPVLACRIIRALALQLKWTSLRNGTVPGRIWRDIGRTYLFAEGRQFALRRVTVYPSKHGESLARDELIKPLMFAVSAPESLAPVEQHIAERIIAHLGDRFLIGQQPDPRCPFCFDLAGGRPPVRERKESTTSSTTRYFGAGEALSELEDLRAYLARAGALPPYVNIGMAFNRDQVDSTLRHLARAWAEKPPTRQGERKETTARLTVVPGLADTSRWLARILSSWSPDVQPPKTAVRWLASDASDGGCGALVFGPLGDWVAVGALVGLRDERQTACRMAIIRRIVKIESGSGDLHRIGMQYIGNAAAPVALFPPNAIQVESPNRVGETAILISSRPDASGCVDLLLQRDGVSPAKMLQMRFLGRVHRVERLKVLERGHGYQWASYRISASA